jgi:uncharacterized membrane protein YtjA (UPF0391 family)
MRQCASSAKHGTGRASRAFPQSNILNLKPREVAMLGWAITFLVIALIAALFGFGGIAGTAIEAAKIVFFVAIVLFVISALVGIFRGRSITRP